MDCEFIKGSQGSPDLDKLIKQLIFFMTAAILLHEETNN